MTLIEKHTIKKNVIGKLPLPTFGLALGVISLGNFYRGYSQLSLIICGIIGFALILRSLIKFIKYPDFFHINIKKPISIGVLGTCPMSLMLLATYFTQINFTFSFAFWLFAITLQLCLIVYFTIKILPNVELKDIYPTYLITYVGVSLISITSPYFNMETILGFPFMIMGLICVFILLSVISYRYLKIPIPKSKKPLTSLFAAPTITVVSYLTVTHNINYIFVIILYLFTTLLYLFALSKIIEYKFKLPWCPNHASYTFPFVINATATKLIYNLFNIEILYYFFIFQTIIATFFVIYECLKFINYIYSDNDLKECY